MSWKCPSCGAAANDDATNKCLVCGNIIDEQEIAVSAFKGQLDEIEKNACSGCAAMAALMIAEEKSRAEVIAALTAEGIDRTEADRIYDEVYTMRSQMQMSAARKTIISGILMCIAAFGVSFATFIAATGVVIIAGGLFFSGVFQVVRGLRMYTR